jgi:isopenicillin N synthase-like dioxygenase
MAPTNDAGKAEDQLASSVQEMSIKGNIPPQNYLLKETLVSAANLPVLHLQTIDIGLLNSSSPEGEQEIKKLRTALESSGYFQAVNHGMTPSFLEEAHAVTRRFFLLPEEEKMKYGRSPDGFDGYGNDPAYSNNQTLDWNDRLYLNVLPESLRKFDKWPKNPENFSDILKVFTEKLRIMNEVILKAMAKSLNLEEDTFINMYGENPTVLSRFNLYPPCPKPELVLASKAHGDASGTTYLLQDKEVEGLQTLKDGQWHRVPLSPDAIVFNLGDQLEIMSNGIFKSPVHRVATNEKKERITVAIFFTPDHKAEVKPADGLINENNPRLYKSVVDYTSDYFKSFQLGRRPIEALKI